MSTTSHAPNACTPTRVAIIGSGNVGSTLAQRIAERNLANVVLLDIVDGRPQGVALDLLEARGIEGHDRQIVGTTDYAMTAGSDVVVITAGLPRRPGMSRDDLLKTNAAIVMEAAQKAIAQSPNAIFIVVTNPLDVMTYLAWKATGLPPERVMGMAGILDSARFQTFIALELGVSTADVSAMVMGSHGDLMVPLPRYSTVNGIPITELLDADTIARLVHRTRNGGAEIVELMQTGGAYYAPASSTCVMVETILLNKSRLLPIASYLRGEYRLSDIFIGVPTRLGCGGAESVLELQLSDSELKELHSSAAVVRQGIDRAMALL
ncbi:MULTISPECIES: malate dehydrogenase [unclassified Thermoleptolyngbya]|uniref:Malate dehydrogenase n=1 Tax=Thermoleptolyngbya oregonensis NK1-22 TaxID=2547457 RepID=A0AA97BQR8_9CYAN|nr:MULTISPECIES: malate dehydrogenase [unclassified Thermoleptolyngbya]MBF2086682.1 malate dehydrogenase [Thermoleptolyngbya sp. C42_A2020_037]WOB44518.1 malate dehydrogenase [Thermoleptolyngbya oregonensis NK1-22]HIK39306.1 malate dehydrogenase [Thermoleptolyngbya sp. M55_K2018_002]